MDLTRSISYILGGEPKNRQDCVDYSSKQQVERIIAQLKVNEIIGEQFVCKQLYVSYVWMFNDIVVVYDEIYGAIYAHETQKRQKLSIDNANRRLDKILDSIRDRVCEIELNSKMFDHLLVS